MYPDWSRKSRQKDTVIICGMNSATDESPPTIPSEISLAINRFFLYSARYIRLPIKSLNNRLIAPLMSKIGEYSPKASQKQKSMIAAKIGRAVNLPTSRFSSFESLGFAFV